jgi:hypothetical protein
MYSTARAVMSHTLWKYSLAGLLVLVPAWATFFILSALFHALNELIHDLPWNMGDRQWPGLSLILFLLLVVIIGAIATHVVGQRIITQAEQWIERVPLVRSLYITLKGMADLLQGGGLSIPSRRSLGDRVCDGSRTVCATSFTDNKFAHGLCAHGSPSVQRFACLCPSDTIASNQSGTGRGY